MFVSNTQLNLDNDKLITRFGGVHVYMWMIISHWMEYVGWAPHHVEFAAAASVLVELIVTRPVS